MKNTWTIKAYNSLTGTVFQIVNGSKGLEPDAKLIAAAPDMLDALEECYYELTAHGISGTQKHLVEQIEITLRKARGEK